MYKESTTHAFRLNNQRATLLVVADQPTNIRLIHFNPTTLRNRVKVHLTLKFQNEYLRQLALIDGLTGIPNWRCFEEQLKLEFQRAKRTNTSLALLMIDVDHFKQYNDQYGHQAGDDCLRKIAEVLKKTMLRAGDLTARYGGEEFVCILPDTDAKGAALIANKLLAETRKLHIENALCEVLPIITMSIGFAVYSSNNVSSPEDLITAADIQLYSAKNNGRNIVFPPSPKATRAKGYL